MTPEHTLLLRCERLLYAVESLFVTLPEKYRAAHLAPKSKELRAEIRKIVPRDFSVDCDSSLTGSI